MAGITRLQLYNNALMYCGERALASLSEDREPKRLLDGVWASNGLDFVLEQAQWHFAMRSGSIDYDPAQTQNFGYQHAFTKPVDWVSTSAVCTDEFYNTPLTAYTFENDFWWCDLDIIYVRYVSNDDAYGGDLTRWPATFSDYAAAYFAFRIINKLGGDRSAQMKALTGPPGREDSGILGRSLALAKTKAAVTQPTQFLPPGSWNRARRGRGRSGTRNDRGNAGSLIG